VLSNFPAHLGFVDRAVARGIAQGSCRLRMHPGEGRAESGKIHAPELVRDARAG
jgi:hypothetical protein